MAKILIELARLSHFIGKKKTFMAKKFTEPMFAKIKKIHLT